MSTRLTTYPQLTEGCLLRTRSSTTDLCRPRILSLFTLTVGPQRCPNDVSTRVNSDVQTSTPVPPGPFVNETTQQHFHFTPVETFRGSYHSPWTIAR